MERRFGGFALAAAAAVLAVRAEEFVLARRGKAAGCGIIIATNADECVRHAAKELQTFTKRMTGVTLPIVDAASLASPPPRAVVLTGRTGVSPASPPPKVEVLTGRTGVSPASSLPKAEVLTGRTGVSPVQVANGQDARCPSAALSPDAFRLCVSNGWLHVTGGGSRGVLYGVYELLERFGGCDWFTPWCEIVPERETFSVPFAESKHRQTVGFCEDLRGWGAICRNLFIYNYATNFRNYLFPFPNVYSMAPNYRLLLENGARWIYDQADGSGYHGEFAELKCYLQSKLMWNPNRDIEPLIDRFMAAYYGAAAPTVRRYFNELYASFSIRNEHNPDPEAEPSAAGIYGENLPQLTDGKLERWPAGDTVAAICKKRASFI